MNIILPDTPASVLQLLNADKSALNKFAGAIIADVKEGRSNPLEIEILIRKYEYVLETIKKEIRENVNQEVSLYGEKPFEYGGATVHYTPTSTKYDFSNDSKWRKITTEIGELSKEKERCEDFLKSVKEPLTVVNQDTGELETISPPNKKSTMGVKVTLK